VDDDANMTTPPYVIRLTSDESHERVFAEICVDGRFVGLVHQELPGAEFGFELPEPDDANAARSVPLHILLDALNAARHRLETRDPSPWWR
jgi:hypothetical protein